MHLRQAINIDQEEGAKDHQPEEMHAAHVPKEFPTLFWTYGEIFHHLFHFHLGLPVLKGHSEAEHARFLYQRGIFQCALSPRC